MDRLFSVTKYVRYLGVALVLLLVFIALVFINNTIRLAIMARRKEIAIMRNVGASNHFIKVPFMIEGVLIGLIGAVLPCILTYFGYSWLYDEIGGRLFTNLFALQPVIPFTLYVAAALAACGVIVGLVGSFASTTRYLHWKR